MDRQLEEALNHGPDALHLASFRHRRTNRDALRGRRPRTPAPWAHPTIRSPCKIARITRPCASARQQGSKAARCIRRRGRRRRHLRPPQRAFSQADTPSLRLATRSRPQPTPAH
jgi:hypothetical protein